MQRRDSPSSGRQMSSAGFPAWAEGSPAEPVNFVYDQNEGTPCMASHNLTQLRYARRDGSHVLHLFAQLCSHQPCERRLPTPRRTPDDRTERYAITDKLAKWRARPSNRNLTHKLVQARRFKPLEYALCIFHG